MSLMSLCKDIQNFSSKHKKTFQNFRKDNVNLYGQPEQGMYLYL